MKIAAHQAKLTMAMLMLTPASAFGQVATPPKSPAPVPPGVAAAPDNAAGTISGATEDPTSATAGESVATDKDDIVVTALRRNQRLQDAPASISVISAATVQSAGINTLQDLSRVVPSLRFENGQRPGVPSISLRGISSVAGGDAPFSLTIDGVQVPFLALVNQDLLDISSIELVRGPQGALYGRGSIAGALVINTRQPDNDLRGTIRFTGQTNNDYRGTVTVSSPIVTDLLTAKITGSYQHSLGTLRNITRDDYNDYIHRGVVRGELLFTPADTTRIALTGSYTRGHEGAGSFSKVPVGVPGAIEDFKTYRITSNFRNIANRKLYNVAVKVDQQTPIGTITSVSQYARTNELVTSDLDYSAVPLRLSRNTLIEHAFNQDLRLTSTTASRFNWIVGVFYQDRRGDNNFDLLADPAASTPQPTSTTLDHFRSKSYAAYAQGTLKLPARFTAVGALRYDVDKRYDVAANIPGSAVSGTFRAWQPSGTLKWQGSRDFMVYATYGRGFRSGGFNTANLVTPIIGARRIYPKEISTNYEVGLKSQLFRNRLTINAALFRTLYNDTQFQQTIVSPPARFITSVSRARVNGGEADLAFRVSPDLTVSSSLSLTDSRIRDFDGTQRFVGNRLPNSYHDNQQVTIDYHPELVDGLKGLFRVDGRRRGRIYYDLSRNFTFKPVAFLDLRAGVETKRLTLSVFCLNATNTRAPDFFSALTFQTSSARLANQPRRFGVDLTVNFGPE